MGHYYLDSSALVKRYIAEVGTSWVVDLCAPDVGNTLYTVRITGAEIVAAMFLRVRMGTLVVSDAQAVVKQFKAVFDDRYQIVEVTEDLVDTAMVLAEEHHLRGYDAIQLSTALALQSVREVLSLSPVMFVCADDRLNAAAVSKQLAVENPNAHP